MMTEVERMPYPAKVNGESALLFCTPEDRETYVRDHPEAFYQQLGLLAIAYFHDPAYREYEYIAASTLDKENEDVWTRDFGLRELMVWMTGIARDRAEADILHRAEREHGSFRSHYGRNPSVIIDDVPSEAEQDSFIEHETEDLWTANGMPIEFFEGNENA